jgi:AraC family transcriptional regulator
MAAVAQPPPPAPPPARVLAAGDGWIVKEFLCHLGPADPRFEERHQRFTIAAVVEGSFQYHCDSGRALLYPGAFLLGNVGACFECGHDHAVGDRCISFSFAPELFEEIAASTGSSPRFAAAMLPASSRLAAAAVEAEARAHAGSPPAMEEFALRLPEIVLGALAGSTAREAAPAPSDQRRISRALRHIEAHAEEPLDLATLAAVAGMSKFRFLRSFRRLLGVTPYSFLLGLRLRRAAVRLRQSREPVASIAFDAGFGDLSTFNHRFRAVFGASPSVFRRR